MHKPNYARMSIIPHYISIIFLSTHALVVWLEPNIPLIILALLSVCGLQQTKVKIKAEADGHSDCQKAHIHRVRMIAEKGTILSDSEAPTDLKEPPNPRTLIPQL